MGLILSKQSGAKGYFSMARRGISDPNAQVFITAAGITDTTQQNAIDQLVIALKAANIWTKIKAAYPMVGGTATTCKWNLKDPQDTNAAYRLSFVGGGTFSTNGYLPNGTNAYAETYLAMSVIAQDNGHMTYYSRSSGAIYNNRYCMGFYHTPFDNLTGIQPTVSGVQYGWMNSFGSGTPAVLSAANTLGFLGTTRLLSTGNKTFKNTSISALANQTSRSTASTTTYYIGSCNNSSTLDFFGNFECAFASIGDGLTDAEISAFYTAVQAFNTTLGRQV